MSANELPDDPHAVRTRHDLSAFVDGLARDLRERPEQWENATLDRFLDALARYLLDIDGYCRNMAPHLDPERPGWELLAVALAGAAVYE